MSTQSSRRDDDRSRTHERRCDTHVAELNERPISTMSETHPDRRKRAGCNNLAQVSDRHRQRRTALGLMALVIGLAGVVFSVPSSDDPSARGAVQAADTQVAAAAIGSASRYVAINPVRVIDTRTDLSRRRLSANGSLSIAPVTANVSNASGVPVAKAQAVVLNVTMVDAGGAGFATIWPTGSPQPTVSSSNTDFAGQTVPNMVTVPLGVDGSISVFSSVAADFIIDVQGVYEGATSATSGRLVPLTPRRAIDTRRGGTLGANSAITVDLAPYGVPTSASAAVLNVTATETRGAGYYTVWPADTSIPVASNLNVPGPGYTVANQVIARVTNGRVNVYSEVGGDVLVDVSGYMTGASAPSATEGLFVPLTPDRLLDTRTAGQFSSGQPILSDSSINLPITGRSGVPASGVQSVALNVTATRTQASGYVTGWPANTTIPDTSSLNFVAAGRTVPNHVITRVNGGAASFYSFGGNDLLVDVMGYYTDPTATIPAPSGGVLTLNTVNPPATTIAPGGPPTNGEYAFLYQSAPKSTASPYGRWNPCDTIVYTVNADRATQVMVDQMNLAIAAIEQATGLDFVYGGATSAGLDYQVPNGADAVIAFSDESVNSDLAGGVIGIGGGSYSSSSGQVGQGFAYADVATFRGTDAGTLGRLRATFQHEIGHMVGLDHVGDRNQLMYASATSNTQFGGGDLRGLWYLGKAQPCFAGGRFAAELDDDTVTGGGGGSSSDTLPADAVVIKSI
jgi:hypothetical protein